MTGGVPLGDSYTAGTGGSYDVISYDFIPDEKWAVWRGISFGHLTYRFIWRWYSSHVYSACAYFVAQWTSENFYDKSGRPGVLVYVFPSTKTSLFSSISINDLPIRNYPSASLRIPKSLSKYDLLYRYDVMYPLAILPKYLVPKSRTSVPTSSSSSALPTSITPVSREYFGVSNNFAWGGGRSGSGIKSP